MNYSEFQQLNQGRQVALLDSLVLHKIGAEVLAIIIAEDYCDHRPGSKPVLSHNSSKEVAPQGDTDRQSQSAGKLLRHENRIAVRGGKHLIKLFQLENLWNELV